METPWKPKHNPWIIAVTVTQATIMAVLDTSIANVALPHIAGSLGASTELPNGSQAHRDLWTQKEPEC